MLKKLLNDLENLKDPAKAKILQRFFKTGKGEYGEGDVFLGIKVPVQRKIARKYKDILHSELSELFSSKIHEHRLIAAFICVLKYNKNKDKVYKFYLKHVKFINNWDIVDTTAPNIIGDYLLDKDRGLLYKFARSNDLWKKRIAILSTYTFIKNNDFSDTLKISEILLNDKHDLIHKGVGWMLREIGNRNQETEEKFLRKYYKTMPRTMLRYAIEKFDDKKRKFYMNK